MMRARWSILLLVCICALVAGLTPLLMSSTDEGVLVPTPPGPERIAAGHYPDTTNGVHLGLTIGSVLQSGDALLPRTRASTRVDYVWSAASPVSDSVLSQNAHLDFYLAPLWSDWAPQSAVDHSLAWFRLHHPDWVVYRCSERGTPDQPAWYGGEPGYFNRVPLDITNPAVKKYLLRAAEKALRAGFNGIAIDNVMFTNYQNVCGRYHYVTRGNTRSLRWKAFDYPQDGGTNAVLKNGVLSYLSFMSDHLSSDFPQATITGNTAVNAGLPLIDFAKYFNGIMDEYGVITPSGQRQTGIDWLRHVTLAEESQRLQKAYIEVAYAPPTVARGDSVVRQSFINWVLANYLLIKNRYAYTYILRLSPGFVDLPAYHISIGEPIGQRKVVNGGQMRRYTGGLVIVNPSASDAITIPLTMAYHDLAGHVVTSVHLLPANAIVLLNGE